MSNIDFTVPASKDEITIDWLRVALASSFPNATFASLEGKRIGEAYGFASHIFRYCWQDKRTPQSVVIKLWNTDSKAGIGEVLFYQTFPEVGTRIPNCYYSKADEETKKAVLVLEDLKDAVQGDVLEPLDLERAKQVAKSLASLHATWLEHPKLTKFLWLPDVSTWKVKNDWIHSRRTLFLNRFGDCLSSLAWRLLDQLERAPAIANERLKYAPTTFLHGDFHLDNFVFEKQIKPVMLDWARPIKGPLALNVANLLFVMTSLQYFDAVIELYLDEFNKLAATSLSKEVLEKQLGGALLRRFASSTCGIALWQPSSSRGVQMIDVDIKQTSRIIDFWQMRDPELFSFLR